MNYVNLSILQIYEQHNTIVTPVVECIDSENGATNLFAEDCTMYREAPYECGNYDGTDFDSNKMCCACGGGINGNTSDLL